jgi:hypothetical protein
MLKATEFWATARNIGRQAADDASLEIYQRLSMTCT